MAGAKDRLIQVSQQTFQQNAIGLVEQLDKAMDELKLRILADLKTLKEDPKRLDDLILSDGDYELKPAKPEIARKEKPALADVRNEAAG